MGAPLPAQEHTQRANQDEAAIAEFYRLSLTASHVYPWLGSMCKTIGHRLSGSVQAEQAVEYSYRLMDSLGLNPVKQPCMVPRWVRGPKEAAGFSVDAQNFTPIPVLALGGSVGTPDGGIEAEIVEVRDWDDLARLGREAIEGKIVFFNEPMDPENLYTFHSYGHCVKHRWGGAVEAARYGAVGAVVRSLNLRIDSFPHTGSMHYEEALDSIPAAAISTRDAERISALLASGKKVTLRLEQHCQSFPDVPSFNVIGEIRGSEHPEKIILIGGHLDSWDVGEGAHDDGAGVMQALGTLELLLKSGYRPRHTIRVVFFMNEENGLRGATAYAEQADSLGEWHMAAIESDRGGFTPRGFHVEGEPEQVARIQAWKYLLEKYGVHQLEEGGSGADIKPLKKPGNVLIGFVPDSQRYFDYHHAPTDTFEAINKRELELGTASIAALVYLLDVYGI